MSCRICGTRCISIWAWRCNIPFFHHNIGPNSSSHNNDNNNNNYRSCPPWSNGCGDGEPHFDVAAPGFDNLQWSTANVCADPDRPGTGFETKAQSEAVGNWWTECSNIAECEHKCEELPASFQKMSKLFASWGWKVGKQYSNRFMLRL